jgi:hypothetical protein
MERMLPFPNREVYDEFFTSLTVLLGQYSEKGKAARHVTEKMGLTGRAYKPTPTGDQERQRDDESDVSEEDASSDD